MSDSKDNHGFSVSVAQEIGVHRAIMLQHFRHLQIAFVEAEKSAIEIWIKRSRRALTETYPYLSEKEIRGSLDRLERDDYIRAKVDNALNYDRTKSYQLSKKGWELLGLPPSAQKADREQKASDKRANGFDKRANDNVTKGPMSIGSCSSVVTSFVEGERTPPAHNPSNLQSQKNESGLVSPPGFGNFDHFSGFGLDYLKTPETVKAETPPLPKVAPKGIPPVRLDAKEIRGLVDLTETYPFGFCETCQGQKVVGGRNGLIECPTCEGTGLGNGRTESENPPPAQFEVTAISSPTELPGVTLVEAAPIHHRRNGRIEIPDEAAAEILPWAKGDGEQTVKSWYDRAFRQHSPKDVEDMVMRFSTVFLSSEKAAFRDMMETNPLSFFKRRFAGFVADQKQYDRNNAPKEGGATRQNGQPHSALPRSLQKQVGK